MNTLSFFETSAIRTVLRATYRLITAAVFLWVAFSFGPEVAFAADADQDQGASAHRWGRILALPFYNMTEIHGEDNSVRGPLSRQVFVTGKVAAEADLMMNRMVERRLAKVSGLAWDVPHDAGIVPLQASTIKTYHLQALSGQGRRQGADHVLAGYLYAFRQRDGGDLGVQIPAKVIFEMVAVQVSTERVVWQKRFNETQQALSDNLMNLGKFIRRKGRWVRAHEMAEHAVREMLDDMFMAKPASKP